MDGDLLRERFSGTIVNWRDDERKMADYFGAPNQALGETPLTLIKPQLYADEKRFRAENPEATCLTWAAISSSTSPRAAPGSAPTAPSASPSRRTAASMRDDVVTACRNEVERTGVKQICLLGDSVGDFGTEWGGTLPGLIRRLCSEIPGLRIAMQDFSPYHFNKFYDDMTQFIRDDLILHLQIPYQSASPRILKLMNRPYTRPELNRAFAAMNELGFKEIDSHMIVGFPGETEEDFDQSVEFALEYRPKYMLVNTFMVSPGMPAAAMPDHVEESVKRRRTADAVARLKAAGIMCNCDFGELAQERLRKMNQATAQNSCACTV